MKIILGHTSLDFDALASMMAAKVLMPEAVPVVDGKSNSFVQEFMALTKDLFPYRKLKDIDPAEVDAVIIVDTADLGRAVSNKAMLSALQAKPLFVFDHHPCSGPLAENMVVEQTGACTTLLVERIIRAGLKTSPMEATLMLLGIYDDTGSLLLENTISRDAAAVAWLLTQGGQLGVVAEYLRRPLTPEQMDLFHQLMRSKEILRQNGLPVFIAHAECAQYVGGLALLIHKLQELEDADVWFIVVKMPGRINIIGRSKADALPVRDILRAFRGAGHLYAASASLKRGDLFPVIEELRQEIRKYAAQPNLARDIMSFPVRTVSPDMTLEDVGNLLLKYAHSGMPVVQNGDLVGVISRRDVDKALKYGLQHAPVKGFMSREIVTASPDMHWESVQKLMVRHDIGRVPVVEDGRLVGIVSRTDVLRLIYGTVVSADDNIVQERSIAKREDTIRLLESLPETACRVLEAAAAVADDMGRPVYLVGGFVRDLLLGEPSQDFDFVIEGNGLQFAQHLEERLDVYKFVHHKEFGTARLFLKSGGHVDIAGSRMEEYDYPGAMPHVEQSTLREDLFRRDFTINAMALCLNRDSYGRLIDYYGGSRDLGQKEIRFLHNMSFIDDATRIMRAVRFAGRYGFRLDKLTREAIGVALEAGAFAKVSPERFTEEWLAIYEERNYQAMLEHLARSRVLTHWFGEDLPWYWGGNPEEAAKWALARKWLLSLQHMDNREIDLVLGRLKLTRSLVKVTQDYMALTEKMAACDWSDLSAIDDIMGDTPYYLRDIIGAQEKFQAGMARYEAARARIRTRLKGLDLVRLGVEEGPRVGELLRRIRRLWLLGTIGTPEEESACLQELIDQR
ncbi:MAG: CBS domain-containing protein [Gracilibacteraceae bacterium]|jgi:tRNA nucleotidyltransferase (CCA-adding enzyme)|nr:CBS domain-containing protein [Gracilibacteraceae bacterium]